MQPIFAIGDIHGQIDELIKALELTLKDEAAGPSCFSEISLIVARTAGA